MIRPWLKKHLSFLLGNSWVLMYHHIDRQSIDPWDLCVTPGRFEEQLQWLRRHCHVQSLPDIVRDWKAGKLKRHSVALTFDDGYLNNYTNARPLLEQYEVPATFFITTQNLLEQQPFWWDELQAIVLEKEGLPGHFSLTIEGEKTDIDLKAEASLNSELRSRLEGWRYPDPPSTKRAALYLGLWEKMMGMEAPGRDRLMEQVRDWAGASPCAAPAIMTLEQVRALGGNPLFTIGAHTLTHPALGKCGRAAQEREMKAGREVLHEVLGQTAAFLAYPYGSYNTDTLDLAQTLGFEAAFTTQTIPLKKSANKAFLGRMPVTQTMNYRKMIG